MSNKITNSIPRPKPNYFLSVISISLVLFLLGLIALLSWHANRLMHTFRESINVIVELKDNITTQETAEVVDYLNTIQSIKAASIDHIDKEEALALMKKEMGDDFLLDEMANPLNEVIAFNMQSDYLKKPYLDSLKSVIVNSNASVTNVYYQETFVDKLTDVFQKVGLILGVTSLLFLIIAITVMHSTIKLAMYSNRFLIKNMELVGASRGFIRRPFLWKGSVVGFVAGIVAILLLIAMIYGLILYVPESWSVFDLPRIGILFGVIVIAGVLISVSSTFFIVSRYIKLRREDMF